MIRSLRMRLFIGVTAASAVVLGILCLAINLAVRRTLQGEFDRVLLEKARSLASMVEQQDGEVHFDYERSQFPEFETGGRAAYFEVYLNGKPYQRSPSLGQSDLALPTAGPARIVNLPNGMLGRQLTLAFEPYVDADELEKELKRFGRPAGVMIVAQDSRDLDRSLAQIAWLTALLSAAATVICGGLLIGVTSRAVRPVRALARRIESLGAGDLSAILDATDCPSELTPVIDRLNDLLRRLAEAFGRERAFTADVAHELRTPLAGLLATLEVCRSRRREPVAYEQAIDKCLSMLGRMQGLVENLLLLARADGGQLTVRTEAVDVPDLLQECWSGLEERARGRRLAFSLTAGGAIAAMADRSFLRIVLNNVLENAISYACEGSEVAARIEAAGKDLAVEVANEGHALSPEDVPQLFKRFWRKDAARSGDGMHAGLGLSLCQRLLMLQDGAIAVRLEGAVFVVRISLPLAASTDLVPEPEALASRQQ